LSKDFCSRCRLWKEHIWHEDKEKGIRVLKCSKCKKNKKIESMPKEKGGKVE